MGNGQVGAQNARSGAGWDLALLAGRHPDVPGVALMTKADRAARSPVVSWWRCGLARRGRRGWLVPMIAESRPGSCPSLYVAVQYCSW